MIKNNIKKILRSLNLNKSISTLYKIYSNMLNYGNKDIIRDFYLFNKKLIKNKNLIFDIGSNIGEYSQMYLKIGAKKIIAIEPQSHIFNILKKNFKNNPKVICLQLGIGSKKGKLPIFICDEADKVSTFSKNQVKDSRLNENGYVWNRKEEVEIITIEDLIKKYGLPDFVKIDVEGFELEIFKGLKSKIPKFQFEFLKKENFKDLGEIFKILDKLGNYEYNMVSNFKANTLLFSNFVDSKFFLKFVININDEKLYGDSLSGDIIVKLK